ncbi:Hydantoinase B/oxoprolinase-domain-containing protein [Polychytrium aggregatum]|uniref:Hydantoinase B/oxoprolinase-domain-containing protein n=1 Tax=Polychytrium aggregatum TaxID=110093 RepID=UPI0022FF2391|nr:Hydantoinase B/oxoprolinase-domain-containing protein [Polychytrium aggregatum]KAI9209509.1 Hydantoinase B/oxoprolinase-domain-containing protein [Polychytrium aggregatum]
MTRGVRICIDRGGTFTDCIGFIPKGTDEWSPVVVKLLSVDPQNYPDAPREGIRRILEIATGIPHPRDKPVDTSRLEIIRMGTTVATNALLERKGEPVALLITKGFKDLLKIGNQSRPKIFDLSITMPDVLFEQVVEVDERVTLVGYTSTKSGMDVVVPEGDARFVKGITGEWVKILQAPDIESIRKDLQHVYDRGIRSVAICLMHAFTYPEHEKKIGEIAKRIGFTHVSLSSEIMPMIKIVARGTSATADAYLTPCLQRYIQGFFSGFDAGIHTNVRVEFMQSDGGLTPVSGFSGFKAILSGPAGGVVGYALTSWTPEENTAVIGFDMGGTSTDVSRYDGRYEHVYETTTAGVTIQAPQLDINTVAAGGGSRLFFRNGMFVVGPESASADPGPACYRKGGPLAITDANLVLGHLIPDYFPKIFGASEKEPLDIQASLALFQQLTDDVNAFLSSEAAKNGGAAAKQMTLDQVAFGFIKVANESMCRPIRELTQAKGYDTANHVLACFGGAGGQHACAIARTLGIKRILIHKYSAILSAYGLSLADVVHEVQEPSAVEFGPQSLPRIQERVNNLVTQATRELVQQGFEAANVHCDEFLNLRYQGTDTALMTLKPKRDEDWDFIPPFLDAYKQEFGFTLSDRAIYVDDIRVRGVGRSSNIEASAFKTKVYEEVASIERKPAPAPHDRASSYFDGLGRIADTPIYVLDRLDRGSVIDGPALVIDNNATIVVDPECSALITSEHVVITVGEYQQKRVGTDLDPIQLSIFGHRFMSIAEQMGRTLQKTAVSTNIKERLDFSCALFGSDGGLVANAPHIPVHLGSMQEAVRWQMEYLKDGIKDGDVLVTNHPAAGGSHLPDITVITPVFEDGRIVFFVASRGHHADIGGLQPGSMPPNSRELYQEGAAIKSFKLVSNGSFDEAGITKILLDEPAQYEGCSGTRCLKDNISDLKAQVAANHRGILLVKSLIAEYGLDVVQAYMTYIRSNAELAVREMLRSVSRKYGPVLHAADQMDDGTPINLTIKIDQTTGDAVFDFTGTGPEVYGNTNAPRSLTNSAIIYCLRSLINEDMPLNQGALAPISMVVPPGSLLAPSEKTAVVGGNVLTSQRLCDVILKAFRACAASQGCMNNFTFGKGGKSEQGEVVEGFGYYETIAGGSGAGPTWNGKSGVHTHMTNTRITDPEILERRYPVILHEFGLRTGSGGAGQFRGGDGCVRDIEFLEPISVSMLSERRVLRPYGMDGGQDGQAGMNLLYKKEADGSYRVVNFGGKNATIAQPGDRIRILTPGGGGWGASVGSEMHEGPEAAPIAPGFGGSLHQYAAQQYSV